MLIMESIKQNQSQEDIEFQLVWYKLKCDFGDCKEKPEWTVFTRGGEVPEFQAIYCEAHRIASMEMLGPNMTNIKFINNAEEAKEILEEKNGND